MAYFLEQLIDTTKDANNKIFNGKHNIHTEYWFYYYYLTTNMVKFLLLTFLVAHRVTLIEFYANWCNTCQSMSPILKELKENYGAKINFVMIDIDALENQQRVEKYAVVGVPQWNILNQEGKMVEQFIGKIPKPILRI